MYCSSKNNSSDTNHMWIWNTIFSKTCASLTCKYIFTLSKTFRALYMKEYWHHFLVSWRLHNSSTQEESELQNQSQTWVDRLLLRPKSAFAVQLLLRFENAFPRELFSTAHIESNLHYFLGLRMPSHESAPSHRCACAQDRFTMFTRQPPAPKGYSPRRINLSGHTNK